MRVRLYLTLDILLEAKFYRVKSHEYRVCLPVRFPAVFFRKPRPRADFMLQKKQRNCNNQAIISWTKGERPRISKATGWGSRFAAAIAFPAQTLCSSATGFIESQFRAAASPLFYHLQ